MAPWRTVELFAGIGGFRLASGSLGIETVWANDIDEKASSVYKQRFGCRSFHDGDIRDLIDTIPPHEILTAGFPCQPFSSAGKKRGVSDPRGTLFFKIVEILGDRQPNFFVLENVKRLLSMDNGRHFLTILKALSNEGYCIEWRVLNAIWFGLPQHRERLIILGWRDGKPRSYLRKDEAITFTAHQFQTIDDLNHKPDSWGMVYDGQVISEKLYEPPCQINSNIRLHHILEEQPPAQFFFTEDTLKRIEKSERVDRYFNGVQILYNQRGGARMGYSIFGVNGVSPTLTSTTSRHYERYKVGSEYRRLTNIEYARLQGFPDHHCDPVRSYHQYSLIGNAVPPPMVRWVMKQLIHGYYIPIKTRRSHYQHQLELPLF